MYAEKLNHLWRNNPVSQSYLYAILSILIALWFSSVMWDILENSRFLLFILAVVFSAYFGGMRSGLLATALSILSLDYFLIEPKHNLNLAAADLLVFNVFITVSFVISWMQEHRRQLIQTSQRTSQELQNIFDSLPVLAGTISLDGKLSLVNRTALEIAHLKHSDVIDKPFEESYWWSHSPEAQNELLDAMDKARAGEFISYNTLLRVGDESYRFVDLKISPLVDEAGQTMYLIATGIDVTEHKQTEHQLRQYMNDLRESNEELRQFAHVASHDLQEPLRMVTSYMQLIEQRYADKLDNDAREFIEFAINGATRMKQLIDDLLFYSRVSQNHVTFRLIDIADVLAEIIKTLSLTIEQTKASITHDDLPQIMGEPILITQLLQNLISNAIKFRGNQPPLIHIAVQREGEQWHFSVRDNGIGISEEFTERVFTIFQRLHTEDEYPGTGIGLAICKKVVEKHNGNIWLESKPGIGTTVHFMLPVRRP